MRLAVVKMKVARSGTSDWHETNVPIQVTDRATPDEIKGKACRTANVHGWDVDSSAEIEVISAP